MKNIFVGVDGGASRCRVRIEDEEGHLLGVGENGVASLRISVEESWTSILGAIDAALKISQLSFEDEGLAFHAGFGLAGCEIPKACAEFLDYPHPFKTVMLKSDGYTSCLGAHAGKDGALIIMGTGTVGWIIKGPINAQVGGWGFPYGDEGSGAWLGLEAVRQTFHAYDGRDRFSPLLEMILQKFDGDASRLVTWAAQARSSDFAALAPLIFDFAKKDDHFALLLVNKAAKEVEKLAKALMKTIPDCENALPLSFAGGIAEALEPWLNNSLREKSVPRQHDAASGAIFMIKRKLGLL